jgi:hypothetical protein
MKMEILKDLLHFILPLFYGFITTNPSDDYARLCQEWIDLGLTQDSSLADVLNICNLVNLEDPFFLLKTSPPLRKTLKFTWLQDHIKYEIHTITSTTLESPQTPVSVTTNMVHDAITW